MRCVGLQYMINNSVTTSEYPVSNEDDRIINVIWEYQENLPAQGQHDKSLKSYPSLPAQLDSHSDTQSGLETVLDL